MRTKKIALNIITDIIPYLLIGIVGLIKVKFLIRYVGDTGNGYYQFINQIISYVFIAQIGFKDGLIYKLYKPFAKKDYDDINAIYGGARKIFKIIGLIIFGIITLTTIGLFLFMGFKDGYKDSALICFFIISTSYLISYFGKTQTYSAVMDANQEKYVYSLILNGLKLLCDILIVVVTYFFHTLESIAIVILIIKIIEEIIIRIVVKKKYPWLHEIEKKDTSMVRMTKDLAWIQVCYVIFNNEDAVLIMLAIGPLGVSIYMAYNFILSFVTEVIMRVNNGILFSFGNVFAKEEKNRAYPLFKELTTLFILISFSVTLTYTLGIKSFINLWIGKESYLLNYTSSVLFASTLFFTALGLPLISIINANGLFKQNKNQLLTYSIINVGLSIILVFPYGINGVLFGTLVAALIGIFLKINIIHKYVFTDIKKKKIILPYLYSTIIYLITSILFVMFDDIIFQTISKNIIICILGIILLFILITSIILLILYLTNKETTINLLSRFKILRRKKIST